MKNSIVVLVFSLTCSILKAEEYLTVKSPYVKEGDARIEKAGLLLANFEEELKWYFDTLKPVKNSMPENSHDYDHLKNATADLQREFVEFRNKVVSCLPTTVGDSSYRYLNYTHAMLNLTHLYVDFMEKLLFPDDWKSQYEKYKTGTK